MSPPLAAEACASSLTEQRHSGAVANRDTSASAETLGALVAPAPVPQIETSGSRKFALDSRSTPEPP
jgi:hypothetical protein